MRKIWMAAVIVGLLGAACAAADEGAGGGAPEMAGAPAPADGEALVAEGEGAADATAGGEGGPDLPGVAPRIVKNGDISVEVEEGGFKQALQRVTSLAEAEGGFVLSSSVSGEKARQGSIVLRVPSDRFEPAMNAIRDLGEVERETISSEDVGQEFVDLEARLRNLTAQEAVLLRLMDEAGTIAETIKVQRELTGIQLEVEQIRGRLRYLEDRTSLATITVGLAETGAAAPAKPGIIQRGWERAVEGFLSVVGGLITVLGVALPFALLGLLAWALLRRLVPRLARS